MGDVHGRGDLLQKLLRRIEADAAAIRAERRIIVFLGDYIDRGLQSRRVVDLALTSLPDGFDAVYLKGNHEQLMLDFLTASTGPELWLANGGGATCASYGLDVEQLMLTHASAKDWREALCAALPDSHCRFYGSLTISVCLGDYFFVHAGVRPRVPLQQQSEYDCIWIRDEFLKSDENFGKIVVHGHTPGPKPVVRANRIGIDTFAWASGRLTALRLAGRKRAFLST